MIHFIAGDLNSGKSKTLHSTYKSITRDSSRCVGGFFSEKIIADTALKGYNLVDLATMETSLLALVDPYFNGEFAHVIPYDRFHFNREAFEYGNTLLESLALNPLITDIFIDEIGRIEILGGGFSQGFTSALASGKNLYVCVRDVFLRDVIKKFNIGMFQIL